MKNIKDELITPFITVNNLMILERLLLEIDARLKYEMNFGDAYTLHKLLKEVGKITSYAFLIQDEYHNKFNDVEKLKEYHKMIMESEITTDTDYRDIIEFIEYVSFKFKDEGFDKVLNNIKFWNVEK